MASNKIEASFKIKDAFKRIGDSVDEQKENKRLAQTEVEVGVDMSDVFDMNMLKNTIAHYIKHTKLDTTIVAALKAHTPLIDGNEICLLVDNALQLSRINGMLISLQNAMVKLLNNSKIKVSVALFKANDSNEEKKLFTASEKFEHFMKLNPAVSELKAVFGLELE